MKFAQLTSVTGILALLATAACTPPAAQRQAALEAEHHFVSVASERFEAPLFDVDLVEPLAACEKNLKRAVCETTASTNEIRSRYETIPCSPNSQAYLPTLMKIARELPERIRPSLCTLYRVFISDGIPSTAFASSIVDRDNDVKGAYIGIRKSTFVKQPSTRELVSWKEQLAFGGSDSFLSNDPSLVQIDYGLRMRHLEKDGLFYVLVHELGHVIDHANSVNAGGGWSRLSWRMGRQPLPEMSFEHRDEFCFYRCGSPLSQEAAAEIYPSLAKSGFITTYSSMNPGEDFAEFWAWYVMIKFKDPKYKIAIPGRGSIDMNPVFTSNASIGKKLKFIEQLWNSPELKIGH